MNETKNEIKGLTVAKLLIDITTFLAVMAAVFIVLIELFATTMSTDLLPLNMMLNLIILALIFRIESRAINQKILVIKQNNQ